MWVGLNVDDEAFSEVGWVGDLRVIHLNDSVHQRVLHGLAGFILVHWLRLEVVPLLL
jgi:hypothetical protein